MVLQLRTQEKSSAIRSYITNNSRIILWSFTTSENSRFVVLQLNNSRKENLNLWFYS